MSHDLTFGLDTTRGVCALKLNDTCIGDQSFEVTGVVPVGGDEDEKVNFISIQLILG